MKYACTILVGQDWFKGGHDHVYAKKQFFITEKDVNGVGNPIKFSQSDFKEFYDTEPEKTQLGNGKTVMAKGLKSFQGTDLGKGFDVTLLVNAAADDGRYSAVNIEASLGIDQGRKFLIGPKKGMAVVFDAQNQGQPDKIETSGTLFLSPNVKKSGPVHFDLSCTNLLAHQKADARTPVVNGEKEKGSVDASTPGNGAKGDNGTPPDVAK